MTSVVLCANGALGADLARWLARRGDLLGLVLHAPERRRETDRLADELKVPAWTWPDGRDAIDELAPDCLLSVFFGHRLNEAWLSVARWRAVNLHPSLLPHNGGANPNIWPLVDGSPAGTTLHVMTPAIDQGDLLAQQPVPVFPDDSAATLYERLLDASRDLFTRTWPTIEEITPWPQPDGGSYHRRSDVASLQLTDDDLSVLDRLRALSFPPWGADFDRDGRRWRAQVVITPVSNEPTPPGR